MSFDELRSQTNLTSNSDPLPSQLFFPPVQLLLEFQDTGREDEGGESGVKIGITDDTYRSSIPALLHNSRLTFSSTKVEIVRFCEQTGLIVDPFLVILDAKSQG